MINANIVAKNTMMIDSVKNCAINCLFNPPKTFLIPISRILAAERLTDILMKLMIAITKINNAIADNAYIIFLTRPLFAINNNLLMERDKV